MCLKLYRIFVKQCENMVIRHRNGVADKRRMEVEKMRTLRTIAEYTYIMV